MRKATIIYVLFSLTFASVLVWGIFFPPQAFLRFQAGRARNTTTVYAERLTEGLLLAERMYMGRFSISRIVYIQDDGRMYSRYFNQPTTQVRGVSGRLVWSADPEEPALELPLLNKRPTMKEVIAKCGLHPIEIEVDALGYLQVMQEDGTVIACDPGYGTGVSPYPEAEKIRYGSMAVELAYEKRVAYLTFDGHIGSDRLLAAEFAEVSTGYGGRRRLFINGEPLIEFQRSLTKDSPRYLGRYSPSGKRWETLLGNGKNTIVLVHSYHLCGNQVIVLGYNKQGKSCAMAINLQDGLINWSMLIR